MPKPLSVDVGTGFTFKTRQEVVISRDCHQQNDDFRGKGLHYHHAEMVGERGQTATVIAHIEPHVSN